MAIHNHKILPYKDGYTEESIYNIINNKHIIHLNSKLLTHLVDMIYAQYPYISKANIALIIKIYFEEFRKALLTNNIIKIDGVIKYLFIGFKNIHNHLSDYCIDLQGEIVDKLKVINRGRRVLTNKHIKKPKNNKKPKYLKKKTKKFWRQRYAYQKRLKKNKIKALRYALWSLAVLKKMVREYKEAQCLISQT